jgi:hypothetical protein
VKALAEEKRKKREIDSEAESANRKKPQRARDTHRNTLQLVVAGRRVAQRLFAAAVCKLLENHIDLSVGQTASDLGGRKRAPPRSFQSQRIVKSGFTGRPAEFDYS